MSKIEELIERVRLTDEEIHKAIPEITHFFQYDEIYPLLKAHLNKVLNDPNLALIVGEIEEIIGGAADPEAYVAAGVGVSWERSAPMYGVFKRAGYKQVIPLAEALKEGKK